MIVYVVCRGEYGQGHSPVAVSKTWSSAASQARRHVSEAGRKIKWHIEEGVWIATDTNGVDQVAIYRMEMW